MPRDRLASTLLTTMLICSMVAACLLFQGVDEAVLRALPALPLAVAVHVAQLAATAMAWRGLFHAPTPGFGLMLRARWIRESLNGLLPLVGIGGGILASTAVVDTRAWTLLVAAAWHFLAWSLGTAEVWVIFWVLDTPAGLAEAYAIQSLGMAARSLGFVVPAGLGAQEAGLIIVAVALGVPVEDAVAMSMLKRLREVLMNLPGLLVWHRLERRAVHNGHV